MKTERQLKFDSKIGPLYLVASEFGLTGVHWEKQNIPFVNLADSIPSIKSVLTKTSKQLEEYFNGTRKKFDVKLDVDGTPFQKKVWTALLDVPFGATKSYSEIAKQISHTNAVRAVGSANGKNPLCVIIPCHRIIAANGKIGGYSGGLDKKEFLLNFEKA